MTNPFWESVQFASEKLALVLQTGDEERIRFWTKQTNDYITAWSDWWIRYERAVTRMELECSRAIQTVTKR